MAPQVTARVRHMDTDTPVEIRVVEDGLTSAYAITREDAALLVRVLERVLRQAGA